MEWLLLLVEVLGLLQQRKEENTSLRTLFRTWPRKGIQRGAVLALAAASAASPREYPRTLVVVAACG